jgi:hypothetical protein
MIAGREPAVAQRAFLVAPLETGYRNAVVAFRADCGLIESFEISDERIG